MRHETQRALIGASVTLTTAWMLWVSDTIFTMSGQVTEIQTQIRAVLMAPPKTGPSALIKQPEEKNDMKSLIAHYRNKYPGGRVDSSESGMSVYDAQGELRVKLARNGAGQLVCVSEEYGCADRHDLSPLPKQGRVHKLGRDGKLGKDELASERQSWAGAAAQAHGGKVPSIEEMEKAGHKFDASGHQIDESGKPAKEFKAKDKSA